MSMCYLVMDVLRSCQVWPLVVPGTTCFLVLEADIWVWDVLEAGAEEEHRREENRV